MLVAGLMTTMSAAKAQDSGYGTQGNTVRDRERPDYDAVGARVGSFRILPLLDLGVRYTDNVFATPGDKISDAVFTVRPQLNVRSDWSRHLLTFSATGNLGFFADLGSEDYEDVLIRLMGQIDITRNSRITLSIGADRLHEARDSPDDAGGLRPTIYYLLTPRVEIAFPLGQISVKIGSNMRIFDYNDTLAAGGVVINEDDRDRLIWEGSLELGYVISPSVRGFVRGTYNIRDYDDLVDDRGRMRDSDGFGVVGGIFLDLTGSLSMQAFIGYRRQVFDDVNFVTIDGITGGLDLTWTPTQLTTVRLGVTREVRETTQLNASGVFRTEFRAIIDHELLRQLIVSVRGGVSESDFRGNGRSDTSWRAGVGATYFINRTLNLDFSYEYRNRESNLDFEDFSRNSASLRLRVQL